MELKEGILVRWNDPRIMDYPNPREAMDRVFVVQKVTDDIVYLSDGYTEVEALPEECEILNKQ